MQSTLDLIIQSIAVGFIIYSIPEALSKVAFVYDELKTFGVLRAFTLALRMIVQCLKCSIYWASWAITGSFPIAGCLALAAYLINKHN